MRNLLAITFKRFVYAVVAVWLLVSVVFFATRYVGDPVANFVGDDSSPELIENIRESFGLNDPVPVQYVNYMKGVVTGDMGNSFRLHQDAMSLVLERLPATFRLTAIAIGLATFVAIPLGVAAGLRPGSRLDNLSRVVAVLGQSLPVFVVAILLILLFAVRLRWFPATGSGTWRHLVLPGLALSAYSIPVTMRLTRSAMLEVMSRDYIRTAAAKGVSRRRLVLNHGLRNAMIPIITIVALRLGAVITGAIVLEEVFAFPGLGRLAVQSMLAYDYPVIQAFIIVIAVLVIGVNFISDVLYTVADPRIRMD